MFCCLRLKSTVTSSVTLLSSGPLPPPLPRPVSWIVLMLVCIASYYHRPFNPMKSYTQTIDGKICFNHIYE